jgi:hypothetical protein
MRELSLLFEDSPLEVVSSSLSSRDSVLALADEGCALCGQTVEGGSVLVSLKCRVLGCLHVIHSSCVERLDSVPFPTIHGTNQLVPSLDNAKSSLKSFTSKKKFSLEFTIRHILSDLVLKKHSFVDAAVLQEKDKKERFVFSFPDAAKSLAVSKGRISFRFKQEDTRFLWNYDALFDVSGIGAESIELISVDSVSNHVVIVSFSSSLHGFGLKHVILGLTEAEPIFIQKKLVKSAMTRDLSLSSDDMKESYANLHMSISSSRSSPPPTASDLLILVERIVEDPDSVSTADKGKVMGQIRGNVRELAKSQAGSRFLQDRIKDGDTTMLE